ncbi:MAG: phenylalanine--tRNA ligase subunit beta [Candidatus Pacearchaeota archaeon]|jgi:phenylalanyl-tRNA synthetase beta chain
MANIKISRKQFEKDIGKLDEKMQQRIALFGTPLESFNEEEIEIEIFPNRPDLLSYSGFKRSFLAFLEKKPGLKKYELNKPEKDYEIIVDSSVKDIRPFTACAIVKDLKLDNEKIKEIIDIQEKLHATIGRKRKKLAIGVYPLEKIKLPIYYKALEPDKIKFIPLDSPGGKEMSGLEILQRHPTGRDYASLLKGKVKFPIFHDSNNQVLSMPPIINSENTGRVDEKTKDIFIECSGYNLDVLEKCINILSSTFADIGGKVYQMKIKSRENRITPNFQTEKIKFSLENSNKLLGLNLQEKDLKKLFEKMGHDYDSKTKEVEIAPWRTDILHEVDLIEEIAIAYGYENFVPEIPNISSIGEENFEENCKKKISEILIGLNFLEVSNFHLTTLPDQFEKMGIPEKTEKDCIFLIESKTEYNILRKNLSSYILKTFSRNIDSEYPQKIFEIGKIFEKSSQKEIIEKEKLSIGIAPGNFTDMKQVINYLEKMMNIKLEYKESQKDTPLHLIDGRTAEINFKNKIIGFFGEVHPKILKNWKIKMPISILEIDLKEIFEELKSRTL